MCWEGWQALEKKKGLTEMQNALKAHNCFACPKTAEDVRTRRGHEESTTDSGHFGLQPRRANIIGKHSAPLPSAAHGAVSAAPRLQSTASKNSPAQQGGKQQILLLEWKL